MATEVCESSGNFYCCCPRQVMWPWTWWCYLMGHWCNRMLSAHGTSGHIHGYENLLQRNTQYMCTWNCYQHFLYFYSKCSVLTAKNNTFLKLILSHKLCFWQSGSGLHNQWFWCIFLFLILFEVKLKVWFCYIHNVHSSLLLLWSFWHSPCGTPGIRSRSFVSALTRHRLDINLEYTWRKLKRTRGEHTDSTRKALRPPWVYNRIGFIF